MKHSWNGSVVEEKKSFYLPVIVLSLCLEWQFTAFNACISFTFPSFGTFSLLFPFPPSNLISFLMPVCIGCSSSKSQVCWKEILGNYMLLGAVLIPFSAVSFVKNLWFWFPQNISQQLYFSFSSWNPCLDIITYYAFSLGIDTLLLTIHLKYVICMEQVQIILHYHHN